MVTTVSLQENVMTKKLNMSKKILTLMIINATIFIVAFYNVLPINSESFIPIHFILVGIALNNVIITFFLSLLFGIKEKVFYNVSTIVSGLLSYLFSKILPFNIFYNAYFNIDMAERGEILSKNESLIALLLIFIPFFINVNTYLIYKFSDKLGIK
jgi:hypothetical protein